MSLFITFEGIDGSGKTLQIKLLKEKLENIGLDVLVAREPGGTKIGEKVRNIVIDKNNTEMSYTTEALLYATSRAQLVDEVLKPALAEGKIVVLDRFVDSSIVYQGKVRGLGEELIVDINKYATNGLVPDITFLLDVTPEVSIKRRNKRFNVDRLESEGAEFFQNLRHEYLHLASKERKRIVVINSAMSPNTTNKIISKVLKNRKLI